MVKTLQYTREGFALPTYGDFNMTNSVAAGYSMNWLPMTMSHNSRCHT